jgi:hypothetical protein
MSGAGLRLIIGEAVTFPKAMPYREATERPPGP